MPAAAGKGDAQGIGGRGNGTDTGTDRTDAETRISVQRNNSWHIVQDPLTNHLNGTTGQFFFSRLKYEPHSDCQWQVADCNRSLTGHQPMRTNGGTKSYRSVKVMTTGMSDAIMHRGIGQPGGLLYR